MMDWIDDIVENVWHNYNNRKVVLWGKYDVSDQIKEKLEKEHGLVAVFYVDKDVAKIDNKCVFSSSCLQGKSNEYYVVVPVAYYPSLKEELTSGGILRARIITIFVIVLLNIPQITMKTLIEIESSVFIRA